MSYRPGVLIADADESFVLTIATVLDRMGFDVMPVKTGLDALSWARQLKPELILINPALSLIDGLKVLKEIRKDTLTSFIPVIVISDSMDESSMQYSKSFYCTEYLKKPVNLMHLNTVIHDCLAYGSWKKRKHLRIRYTENVLLSHNFSDNHRRAVTLSEGGVFLRGSDPARVGDNVILSLPLQDGEAVDVTGSVIYTKELYGAFFNLGPGMAIGFDDLSTPQSEMIRSFIVDRLTDGVTESGHVVH